VLRAQGWAIELEQPAALEHAVDDGLRHVDHSFPRYGGPQRAIVPGRLPLRGGRSGQNFRNGSGQSFRNPHGLQRSAAHEHWLYALCVIAWRLNRRKVSRLRSRRYVIEMVKGACEDPTSHPN
jgi:hypothetical protein